MTKITKTIPPTTVPTMPPMLLEKIVNKMPRYRYFYFSVKEVRGIIKIIAVSLIAHFTYISFRARRQGLNLPA